MRGSRFWWPLLVAVTPALGDAGGAVEAVLAEQLRAYTAQFLAVPGPLVPDRFTRFPELASNDGLLGLAIALLAGPELGLIEPARAEARAAELIGWLRGRIARDASGMIVHFSQTATGAAAAGSETSILTAAYSVLAARLLAGRWPSLAPAAEAYAESIRWTDYLAPSGRLYFSRNADGELRDEAGYYTDEFLVVFAVARASRAHRVPATIWREGLIYRPASCETDRYGRLELGAVTDDAASFEVVLFGQFWDPAAAPTPIDLRGNLVATLLAQRHHNQRVLGLPVGLGRSPQYHRDGYLLLGAAPFGGSDRSRHEPELCGPTQALAALPFERLDPRLDAAADVLTYAGVPGLRLAPHGAFAESVRFTPGGAEPGEHLTSWNATLALAGLYNRQTNNGLWRLHGIALDPR